MYRVALVHVRAEWEAWRGDLRADITLSLMLRSRLKSMRVNCLATSIYLHTCERWREWEEREKEGMCVVTACMCMWRMCGVCLRVRGVRVWTHLIPLSEPLLVRRGDNGCWRFSAACGRGLDTGPALALCEGKRNIINIRERCSLPVLSHKH